MGADKPGGDGQFLVVTAVQGCLVGIDKVLIHEQISVLRTKGIVSSSIQFSSVCRILMFLNVYDLINLCYRRVSVIVIISVYRITIPYSVLYTLPRVDG